jgi:hypothetical protein
MTESLQLGNLELMHSYYQRSTLWQIVNVFRHDPAFKLELCIVYTWRQGYPGIPLNMFEDIGKGKWIMKENLAPMDDTSVQKAIQSMRTTPGTILPNFDLRIGYSDPQNTYKASEDFVKIRYRQNARDTKDGLNPPPDEPAPVDMLECDFTPRSVKDLHRLAWTRQQSESVRYINQARWKEHLQQIAKDYAKAFPDSEDDRD